MDKKDRDNLEENVELWKDILIEDEPFDFAFLEKIILHKVNLMRDYYLTGKSRIAEQSLQRIVKEMTQVIEALERLLADRYLELEKELEIEWEENVNVEGVKEYKMHYLTDYQPEELKKFYQEAEVKRLKDRHLVYDTLRDCAPGWWD